MAKLLFSQLAEADLRHIRDYLTKEAGEAMSDSFIDEVDRICDLIEQMPDIGTAVEFLPGIEYQMFPIGQFRSYLIFYAIVEETIVISRVLHGRQDIEKLFDDE